MLTKEVGIKNIILVIVLSFIFALKLGNLSSFSYARVIKDFSSLEFEYLEKAIISTDENSRYKNLTSVWEEKVGRESKLKKIQIMVDIFNILEELVPSSYIKTIEKRMKDNFPQIWLELVAASLEIGKNPEKKLDIITDQLWQKLNAEEKDIFRAAGLTLKINPRQLLYEYITEVSFNFILAYIYHLSDPSIRDISLELNLHFGQDNPDILREKILKISKSLFDKGFDLEKLLPLVISLSSRNSQEIILEFEENLIHLHDTVIQLKEASLEAQAILAQLLYHTQKGHLESDPDLFRDTYLNAVREFVLHIKDIYSVDLMKFSLNTAFKSSIDNAYEFYNNLMSLKYFILELNQNFPFSLDLFVNVISQIEIITKNFPLRSNISAVMAVCEILNKIKLNPNNCLLKLVKTIMSISFENGSIFRSHMKTIETYFLKKLVGIKIDFEYFLNKWIPLFVQKVKECVDSKEYVVEALRYNFIISLKDLLLLLWEKNIYTQSVIDYIIKNNLELTKIPSDFMKNTKVIQFLIKDLTSNNPSSPSFLRYLIDKSFQLSKDSADYRLNINFIKFLIQKLNLAEIPPSEVLKQLIYAAELTANNNSEIYRVNLSVIQQFIEDLTPYKEELYEEIGITLEEILKREIPKIAEEAKGNYLKFRQDLRYLKMRLIG